MSQPAYSLSPERIAAWIRHWLNTPPEAYLGTGYGFDGSALLMRSLGEGSADALIAKMRADIPLLASLPSGAVTVLAESQPPDTLKLTIVIGAAIVSASVNSTTGALRGTAQE